MRSHRTSEVVQLHVVGRDDTALHRRNVMREERAERVDVTERATRFPLERGAHRFAVVFEQIQTVTIAERPELAQCAGVAQDADGHDHSRSRRQRLLELGDVHVQRRQVDIDEPKPKAVLLQRVVGGRPGNRWDDDLVTSLQGSLLLVEECGDSHKVGRRSRADHQCVPDAELPREVLFELLH